MRRRGIDFLHDAAHLGDFFHQVQLCRQTPRGIGQDHVDAACAGGVDGIEHHRGRIAGFLGDDGDAVALAPGGELLAGGGTEGVAGGQQHALALALEMLGQLADRGGFAGPIDAGDHDHERLLVVGFQRLFERREQGSQTLRQGCPQLGRGFQLVTLDGGLEFGEQPVGRLDAAIGHQQRALKIFEQFIVDLRPAEKLRQRRVERGTGAGKAGLEAFAPRNRWRRSYRSLGGGGVFCLLETKHAECGRRREPS